MVGKYTILKQLGQGDAASIVAQNSEIAAPLLGGLGLDQLAFVRSVRYRPERTGNDFLIAAPWEERGFLSACQEWAIEDGIEPEALSKKLPPTMGTLRNSIHGSLNHDVSNHLYGNWDNAPYVLIASLQNIIRDNGNPTGLGTVDTYWALSPGEKLHMADAALVRPMEQGDDLGDALHTHIDRDVVYRISFDDESETKLRQLPIYETESVCLKVSRVLDKPKKEIAAQLALPRNQRDPNVAAIVDREFTVLLKQEATHNYLKESGYPVRPGGMWSWKDSNDVSYDTKKVAIFLDQKAIRSSGTRLFHAVKTDPHNGSNEDSATKWLYAGGLDEAKKIQGLSPGTCALIDHLASNPDYQAYADTVRSKNKIGSFINWGNLEEKDVKWFAKALNKAAESGVPFVFRFEGEKLYTLPITSDSALTELSPEIAYGNEKGHSLLECCIERVSTKKLHLSDGLIKELNSLHGQLAASDELPPPLDEKSSQQPMCSFRRANFSPKF